MLITLAKRSVGYLLLLAAIAIVVTWWARNDMAIQHDQQMRDWAQEERSPNVPALYDEDAYPEPSVAWYGLAALAAGIGGVVVLERTAYKRGDARTEPDKADVLV
jgi:hypothetical protein